MKGLNIVKYITLLTGIGLLVGAYYSYQNTQKFIENSTPAKGVVIDLIQKRSTDSDGYTSYVYYPLIEFETAEGEAITFESNFGSSPPSYNVGETVDILYLADDPYEATIKSLGSLWFLPILLAGMGGVELMVGLGIFFFVRRKAQKIAWLQQFGHRIQAKFKSAELNTSYKVNGRSPYRIYAQWDENGQVYLFHSENLWFDPSQYLQKDQEITVMVDPQNKKKYWMDVSFLPRLEN